MGGERADEEPTDAADDPPDSTAERDADPDSDPLGGDPGAGTTAVGEGSSDRPLDEAAVEEARAGSDAEVDDDAPAETSEDDAPTESPEDDSGEETSEDTSDEEAYDDDHGDEADPDAPEELEDVDGVGPSRADALREAGYDSVDDVRRASLNELADVDGIGGAIADRIKADVGEAGKELLDVDDGPPDAELLGESTPDDDPEDEPLLSGPESDEEMPLTAHIEEMVKRLAIVIAIAGVVSLVTLPFAERIINLLWYNIMPGVPSDIARPRLYGVLELLFTKLKVASLAGLIVALPALVYETYQFMRPGLYPHERRYYLAAVPASLVLALVGVSFAYFVVLPAIFTYFLAYSQDVATIGFALGRTFNLILALMGYLALVFQIPLFIMLAMMMGLVTRRWLANRRLLFWGAFLGVSFIFSPDPTGMAPVVIALTMVGLFEGTLLLTKWTGRE